MLAQRVRDLVSHHDGDLAVGEVQLVDEAGVEGDLAAGHAERVELRTREHVDLPLPPRRVAAEDCRVRLDAARDRAHAFEHGGIAVERARFGGIGQQLRVGLRRHLVELAGGHEHQLRAVGADGAGRGGGLAPGQRQEREAEREGAHQRLPAIKPSTRPAATAMPTAVHGLLRMYSDCAPSASAAFALFRRSSNLLRAAPKPSPETVAAAFSRSSLSLIIALKSPASLPLALSNWFIAVFIVLS